MQKAEKEIIRYFKLIGEIRGTLSRVTSRKCRVYPCNVDVIEIEDVGDAVTKWGLPRSTYNALEREMKELPNADSMFNEVTVMLKKARKEELDTAIKGLLHCLGNFSDQSFDSLPACLLETGDDSLPIHSLSLEMDTFVNGQELLIIKAVETIEDFMCRLINAVHTACSVHGIANSAMRDSYEQYLDAQFGTGKISFTANFLFPYNPTEIAMEEEETRGKGRPRGKTGLSPKDIAYIMLVLDKYKGVLFCDSDGRLSDRKLGALFAKMCGGSKETYRKAMGEVGQCFDDYEENVQKAVDFLKSYGFDLE